MQYDEFFKFTKQERSGIAVFIVLALIIYILGEFWPQNPEIPIDYSQFYISKISKDTLTTTDTSYIEAEDDNIPIVSVPNERFAFDPNTISYDSLLLLGFGKHGAKNLKNYISKGGKIKDERKFKSIYGIDTSLINDLGSLVQYPISIPFAYEKSIELKKEYVEKSPNFAELNSADSLTLIAVKGIGPYMAKRILSFRKRLGGFLYKEQLTELKIIADSLFQPVSTFLTVNPALIDKIDINSADYKTFTTHPYFSSKTANAIIKYRNQHGSFTDINHISRIRSLNEDIAKQILPYIKVQ